MCPPCVESRVAYQYKKMEAYSIGSLLGQGAFGKALLVSRKSDGAELAMKQMAYSAMSAAEQKASLHEVSLLSRLKHPNIIGYHDAFLEDGQLCIVMELASGGSLEDELAKAQKVNQPLAEARLLDLFAQLADAVHYMASLPLSANVLQMTVMATAMPFVGRG